MVLGEWLEAALEFLGPGGLLVAIFLIFLVDAAIFPALPELFIVAFYFALTGTFSWDPLVAAGALLALAVVGDLCGNAGLYSVVRYLHARDRIPRFVERAMRRWTSFLAVSDERVILVNRIAPAVPLTGAFIAVLRWNLRRSLSYVLVGGVVKYSALLALTLGLGVTFDPDTARLVTIVAILVLISVSLAAGYRRRKAMEAGA